MSGWLAGWLAALGEGLGLRVCRFRAQGVQVAGCAAFKMNLTRVAYILHTFIVRFLGGVFFTTGVVSTQLCFHTVSVRFP